MHQENLFDVVFIDWNGTLSCSKFWGHLDVPNESRPNLLNKIETELFKKRKKLVQDWMRGRTSSESVSQVISQEVGLPSELILSELKTSCESMQFASQDFPRLVRKLRDSKFKVIIATDNMDSFTRWTVPKLELNSIFDGILNSNTVGAVKGDFDMKGNSLFFSAYLSNHSIEPNKCILFDDSEDRNNCIASMGIEYRRIKSFGELENELELLLC